jgi:sulfate transport system ATP-binding protein
MEIVIKDAGKDFGNFSAVKNVSLEIPSGDFVALLGPSGSGKTTLLRLIAGLEALDSGEISFNGNDYSNKSVKERKVGFVFQHYALFKHMNIFENVAFGLKVKPRKIRLPKKEIQAKVFELLKFVQLEHHAEKFPSQLSGGQRQRIALARALAAEPEVLLLDEPFGALDAKVRQELRHWLREIHQKLNITTIFVTHDQEEALEMADTVVIMDNGEIEQIGSPHDVYHFPANRFVYSFLGRVNEIKGNDFVLGTANFHSSNDTVSYIRPHEILLGKKMKVNSIPSEVLHVYSIGYIVRFELRRIDTEDFFEVEMTVEKARELGPIKKGDILYADFENIVVFGKNQEQVNPKFQQKLSVNELVN